MRKSVGAFVLACVLSVASGCPEEEEGAPEVAGTFGVTSTIDIRAANVLPTAIYDKLEVLRALRDDPGDLFFELLEEAGLPLVGELRDMLPDAVEDKVSDWITDAIPDAAKAQIDAVLMISESSLGKFDLLSDLEIPPGDGGGRARATHRLSSLRFMIQGRAFDIAIPPSSAPPFVSVTEVETVVSEGGENGADAQLTLAAHSFGLHYGEFAYQVIEKHVEAQFGVDLRTYLGTLVSCPAVAAEVASKCVLGVCVGHKEKLEELCNKGLDAAVEKLHEKLAEMRFDAVVFSSGEADLWDDVADDGVLDLLDGGVWQASINLGQGLRPAPATFVGSRR